jgi:hypothetical protein
MSCQRERVIRPNRSRAAGAALTRQRVAAALASRISAGRSRKSGKPASAAANCSLWLDLRSSLSIKPATAAGARECSASSIAHKVCLRCDVSTRRRRLGSRPSAFRPCPYGRPSWRYPKDGRIKKSGAVDGRASSATMKPKAAGMASPPAGTISCSPPQGRPPRGRQRSMAGRPKGMVSAIRNPSILGNKRRNSSATAARLRMTVRAVGGGMGPALSRGDIRTKQEHCQGCLRFIFGDEIAAAAPCWPKGVGA